MLIIPVAALSGDLLHRKIRGNEQHFRMFDPTVDQILHKGHAELLFVKSLECRRTHADFMGRPCNGTWIVGLCIDFISHGHQQFIAITGNMHRRLNILFADFIA